mmetsp:Transcript_18714/g.33199  ORF Transcript_18714/g.33199 Transcript_18714/m.33199 type:complete len:204 (+) Transcript_18714:368-979(+)
MVLHFAAMTPRPRPGKMYELLPWPGSKVRLVPSFNSTSTTPNGDPLAKMQRPSVHEYAWYAVHSACEVGFDRAKMSGTLWYDATASHTSCVKVLGIALTPINTDGSSARTAVMRSLTSLPDEMSIPAALRRLMCTSVSSCAKSRLWCCSASMSRSAVISPLLSTSQICERASSSVLRPSLSSWIAKAIRLAIPVPASPAPRNT